MSTNPFFVMINCTKKKKKNRNPIPSRNNHQLTERKYCICTRAHTLVSFLITNTETDRPEAFVFPAPWGVTVGPQTLFLVQSGSYNAVEWLDTHLMNSRCLWLKTGATIVKYFSHSTHPVRALIPAANVHKILHTVQDTVKSCVAEKENW